MLTEQVIEELAHTSQVADRGESPIGLPILLSSNSMSTQDTISMDNDSLLRTVIENLNDGIIVTDLENRILHVNSRLAKLVGCEASDMLGQLAQPFLSMIEGWLFFCATSDDAQTGLYEWREGQLKRQDGRQFWAEVNSTPLCNSDGHPIATLITVTDITERK